MIIKTNFCLFAGITNENIWKFKHLKKEAEKKDFIEELNVNADRWKLLDAAKYFINLLKL